jgi:hypothetical protein
MHQINIFSRLTGPMVAPFLPAGALAIGCQAHAVQTGATINVVAAESGVTVNSANVVTADVEASNGVIHVIDAVILPPAPVAAKCAWGPRICRDDRNRRIQCRPVRLGPIGVLYDCAFQHRD